MDLYFSRMDTSVAATKSPRPQDQTVDTVIFPDLPFLYDSQALRGWEFYSTGSGTFEACVWKPLGEDRYELKSVSTFEVKEGENNALREIPRMNRVLLEKQWVFGITYPEGTTDYVVGYYQPSNDFGTYHSKMHRFAEGQISVGQTRTVTEKGTTDIVPALRPIVTNRKFIDWLSMKVVVIRIKIPQTENNKGNVFKQFNVLELNF